MGWGGEKNRENAGFRSWRDWGGDLRGELIENPTFPTGRAKMHTILHYAQYWALCQTNFGNQSGENSSGFCSAIVRLAWVWRRALSLFGFPFVTKRSLTPSFSSFCSAIVRLPWVWRRALSLFGFPFVTKRSLTPSFPSFPLLQ